MRWKVWWNVVWRGLERSARPAWVLGMATTWLPACEEGGELPAPSNQPVGVYFFPAGEPRQCPNRAWSTVNFILDNEEGGTASELGTCTGWHWALPEIEKDVRPCARGLDATYLSFCHVDVPSDTFRPLTTDPEDASQFYAVLKLGEECPKSSVEVVKTIENFKPPENSNNKNELSSLALQPGGNISDKLGYRTRMVFCFFGWAERAEDTMQAFPDLGMPYSVFHDFDVPQPSWVIEKRWSMTDDSNGLDQNTYWPNESDPIYAEFTKLVEDAPAGNRRDTCFDLARVR